MRTTGFRSMVLYLLLAAFLGKPVFARGPMGHAAL